MESSDIDSPIGIAIDNFSIVVQAGSPFHGNAFLSYTPSYKEDRLDSLSYFTLTDMTACLTIISVVLFSLPLRAAVLVRNFLLFVPTGEFDIELPDIHEAIKEFAADICAKHKNAVTNRRHQCTRMDSA